MDLWYAWQANGSDSKPAFTSGHSFQAFGVLCQAFGHFFCVPVCARIHEGVVGSNRDRRSLVDKANALLADAYFANRKVARALCGRGCSLVTRVRSNTVVHRPARGRAILMTTDLTLSAREVVAVYALRFKIEDAFPEGSGLAA